MPVMSIAERWFCQSPPWRWVAGRLVTTVFDLLLAFFAYRIVAVLRPARPWLAVLAAEVGRLLGPAQAAVGEALRRQAGRIERS